MTPPLMLWAAAFVWTCAFEFPVYFAVLSRSRPERSVLRIVVAALTAQWATHPALWYKVPRFDPYWAWVSVAEVGVTLVEILVVKRIAGVTWLQATLASVAANTFSTLAGLQMVPWLAEAWTA
ncbi:MAG: hypothetical protein IV100_24585 [Myxococcales bacterium]|nr:hypothetical protein [Myxococcales bacterium]